MSAYEPIRSLNGRTATTAQLPRPPLWRISVLVLTFEMPLERKRTPVLSRPVTGIFGWATGIGRTKPAPAAPCPKPRRLAAHVGCAPAALHMARPGLLLPEAYRQILLTPVPAASNDQEQWIPPRMESRSDTRTAKRPFHAQGAGNTPITLVAACWSAYQ